MSVPVSSQSTNDCYEALGTNSAITALAELCEGSTSRPVKGILPSVECPTEPVLETSKMSKTARKRRNKRLKRLESGPASVLSTDQKADNIVDDGSSFSVVSWIIASEGVIKQLYLNRPGTTGFRNEDKYSVLRYSGINRP